MYVWANMSSGSSAALGDVPRRVSAGSSTLTIASRCSNNPLTNSFISEQLIGGVRGLVTESSSSDVEVIPVLPQESLNDDGVRAPSSCATPGAGIWVNVSPSTSSANIQCGAPPVQPIGDNRFGAPQTQSSDRGEVVEGSSVLHEEPNVISLASVRTDMPTTPPSAHVRDAHPSGGVSPRALDGVSPRKTLSRTDACSPEPRPAPRAKTCVASPTSGELTPRGLHLESAHTSMPATMSRTRSFFGSYANQENATPLSSLSEIYKARWRKNLKELPVGICSPYFIFAGASSAALENDRVVQGDVCRTRAHLPYFRAKTQVLASAITQYCNACKIAYRQGFNEIMAPFVILEPEDELRRLVVFHSFFSSYLRPYYVGDFCNLQNVLSLVSTLLLYHCPELATLLSLAGLEPVCYATPWLLTLFASKLDLPNVFALWDKYIERGDKTFLPFICVAVLAKAEAELLQTEFSALPEVLSGLTPLPIDEVWEKALVLQTRSPPRFARFVISIFGKDTGEDVLPCRESGEMPAERRSSQWKELYAPTGPVALTPQEVLLECEWHGGLVVLDSRPRAEFEGPTGRLPKAVPVHSAQQAIDFVKASTNRACHFCFIDPILAAECATDAYGAQVCTVSGGYAALHNLALQEALELVDHSEQACLICRPEWVHKAERTAERASKWISNIRPMQSVKSFASKMGGGSSGRSPGRCTHKKLTATVALPIVNQIGSWRSLMERERKNDVPCIVVLSEELLYVTEVDNQDLDNVKCFHVVLAGPFNLKDVTKITKRQRKTEGSRVFYFRDIDRNEYTGFALNFDIMDEALGFTEVCQRAIRKAKMHVKSSKATTDQAPPVTDTALHASPTSASSSQLGIDAQPGVDVSTTPRSRGVERVRLKAAPPRFDAEKKTSQLSLAWSPRFLVKPMSSSPFSGATHNEHDGSDFVDERLYPSISASSKLKEGQLLRVLHVCELEDKEGPSNNIIRKLKAGENLIFIQRGANCRLKVECTLDNALGWVSANYPTGQKLVGTYPKEKKPWPSVLRKSRTMA